MVETTDTREELCDDLVGAVLQAALHGDPGVGKRVGEWARLLEDTARVLLVARELARGYWGQVETTGGRGG